MRIKKMVHGVTFGMVIAMMLGLLVIPQSTAGATLEEGGSGCDFENASGNAVVVDKGFYFDLDITWDPDTTNDDDNGGIMVAGGNVIKVEQNGAMTVYEFDHALTARERVKDANKVDGWFVFYRDYTVDSNEYADESYKTTEGGQVLIESIYEWDGKYVESSAFGDMPVDLGGEYTATFSASV